MQTLFVFLVRRDQVAQIVAYLTAGLLVLAVQWSALGAEGERSTRAAGAALAAAPVAATQVARDRLPGADQGPALGSR
ncbi:MAG TPA: hypothetical protein VL200_07005 [Lacunisphaera sp.]|jgi:hypothetical protein|nr:hypothetical protein [Lacunisphaera sp.]